MNQADHAGHSHDHLHGTLDPVFLTTQRGIWALKWSLWGLLATAFLQLGVVLISHSVALLADTIHNFGDAAIAIPLWIAFLVARKPPTNRFTYGYGRMEDLAGIVVVVAILLSGVVVGYESLSRLLAPRPVEHLWAVAVASVIGFLGNEAVAVFRIKVGNEIGSAALVAEGQHARTDGLGSLAVLVGAFAVWMGFPLADPLIGLLGESVRSAEDASAAVERYLRTLDALAARGLARNVSLKLSQMGLALDGAICRDNVARIFRRAAELDAFVRIDMEDHTTVDATLG